MVELSDALVLDVNSGEFQWLKERILYVYVYMYASVNYCGLRDTERDRELEKCLKNDRF